MGCGIWGSPGAPPYGELRADGFFRSEDHVRDGAAGGHHWIHVLFGRHFDVQKIGAVVIERVLQGGLKLARVFDRAALEAVLGSQLYGIGERVESDGTEAVVVE